MKRTTILIIITQVLCIICSWPSFASSQNIKVTYENPAFIKEDSSNLTLDSYEYFWYPSPNDSNKNLPPFVKNIYYKGIIEELRNKYFLTSSQLGKKLEITLTLKHDKRFTQWIPVNLRLAPDTNNNAEQEVRLSLSYANSSLGNIVYIQKRKANSGSSLNLIVKMPPQNSDGELTIELRSKRGIKSSVSGIVWNYPTSTKNEISEEVEEKPEKKSEEKSEEKLEEKIDVQSESNPQVTQEEVYEEIITVENNEVDTSNQSLVTVNYYDNFDYPSNDGLQNDTSQANDEKDESVSKTIDKENNKEEDNDKEITSDFETKSDKSSTKKENDDKEIEDNEKSHGKPHKSD